MFSPLGRTTLHVVWDLSVQPLDAHSCEYINHVMATATDAFLTLINEHGISLEQAAVDIVYGPGRHTGGGLSTYTETLSGEKEFGP
ncbi:MAG TPA: hypothetical protein VGO16_00440 [Pseudonocardiaceae bacterium]|nr:hypothetical protein [Pseudonocardiaceae bacterium]